MSEIKQVVEGQNQYFIVGDSSYGISDVLKITLLEAEINNEENADTRRRKIQFNGCLSGARTVMSENLYGTLKRRWPILKNMHHHMRLAQKAIKVCYILENICRDWNEMAFSC